MTQSQSTTDVNDLIGPAPYWVEEGARPQVAYIGAGARYTWIRRFSDDDAAHLVTIEQTISVNSRTVVPRVARNPASIIHRGPQENPPAVAAQLAKALAAAAAALGRK